MKNGKEHGLVTEWYENGKKEYEGNFKDGKKLSETIYENGEQVK